jgi:hypothetical protein
MSAKLTTTLRALWWLILSSACLACVTPKVPQPARRDRVVLVVIDGLTAETLDAYLALPMARRASGALWTIAGVRSLPGEALQTTAGRGTVRLPLLTSPDVVLASLMSGLPPRALGPLDAIDLGRTTTLHDRARALGATTVSIGFGRVGATHEFEGEAAWEALATFLREHDAPDLATVRLTDLAKARGTPPLDALAAVDEKLSSLMTRSGKLIGDDARVFVTAIAAGSLAVDPRAVGRAELVKALGDVPPERVELLGNHALVRQRVDPRGAAIFSSTMVSRADGAFQIFDPDLQEMRPALAGELRADEERLLEDLLSPGETLLVARVSGCPAPGPDCIRFAEGPQIDRPTIDNRSPTAPLLVSRAPAPSAMALHHVAGEVLAALRGRPSAPAPEPQAAWTERGRACAAAGVAAGSCETWVAKIHEPAEALAFLAGLGAIGAARLEEWDTSGGLLALGLEDVPPPDVRALVREGRVVTRPMPKVPASISREGMLEIAARAADARALVVRSDGRDQLFAVTPLLREWLGPGLLADAPGASLGERVASQWNLAKGVESVLRGRSEDAARSLAAAHPTAEEAKAWRELFLYCASMPKNADAARQAFERLSEMTSREAVWPKALRSIWQRVLFAKEKLVDWPNEGTPAQRAFLSAVRVAFEPRTQLSCERSSIEATERLRRARDALSDAGNAGLAAMATVSLVQAAGAPEIRSREVLELVRSIRALGAGWARERVTTGVQMSFGFTKASLDPAAVAALDGLGIEVATAARAPDGPDASAVTNVAFAALDPAHVPFRGLIRAAAKGPAERRAIREELVQLAVFGLVQAVVGVAAPKAAVWRAALQASVEPEDSDASATAARAAAQLMAAFQAESPRAAIASTHAAFEALHGLAPPLSFADGASFEQRVVPLLRGAILLVQIRFMTATDGSDPVEVESVIDRLVIELYADAKALALEKGVPALAVPQFEPFAEVARLFARKLPEALANHGLSRETIAELGAALRRLEPVIAKDVTGEGAIYARAVSTVLRDVVLIGVWFGNYASMKGWAESEQEIWRDGATSLRAAKDQLAAVPEARRPALTLLLYSLIAGHELLLSAPALASSSDGDAVRKMTDNPAFDQLLREFRKQGYSSVATSAEFARTGALTPVLVDVLVTAFEQAPASGKAGGGSVCRWLLESSKARVDRLVGSLQASEREQRGPQALLLAEAVMAGFCEDASARKAFLTDMSSKPDGVLASGGVVAGLVAPGATLDDVRSTERTCPAVAWAASPIRLRWPTPLSEARTILDDYLAGASRHEAASIQMEVKVAEPYLNASVSATIPGGARQAYIGPQWQSKADPSAVRAGAVPGGTPRAAAVHARLLLAWEVMKESQSSPDPERARQLESEADVLLYEALSILRGHPAWRLAEGIVGPSNDVSFVELVDPDLAFWVAVVARRRGHELVGKALFEASLATFASERGEAVGERKRDPACWERFMKGPAPLPKPGLTAAICKKPRSIGHEPTSADVQWVAREALRDGGVAAPPASKVRGEKLLPVLTAAPASNRDARWLPCEALARVLERTSLATVPSESMTRCRRTLLPLAVLERGGPMDMQTALTLAEVWSASMPERVWPILLSIRLAASDGRGVDARALARAEQIGGPSWKVVDDIVKALETVAKTGKLDTDAARLLAEVTPIPIRDLRLVLKTIVFHPERAQAAARALLGSAPP